jgi:hypothetical protein
LNANANSVVLPLPVYGPAVRTSVDIVMWSASYFYL